MSSKVQEWGLGMTDGEEGVVTRYGSERNGGSIGKHAQQGDVGRVEVLAEGTEGGTREGGGKPERSCTNCLVATHKLAIIERWPSE